MQKDTVYTCEVYDKRTQNKPKGTNLKDRRCRGECTRKTVTVYVVEDVKETCTGGLPEGSAILPPTKMVTIFSQNMHGFEPSDFHFILGTMIKISYYNSHHNFYNVRANLG